jgi:hypothetical protein
VDLRLGLSELRLTPQFPWALLFVAWCAVTAAVLAPKELTEGGITLAILVVLYFVLAHGVQTFRAFEILAGIIVACSLLISTVCVHQGLAPFQCVGAAPGAGTQERGVPDGRSCQGERECFIDPPDPELDYRCERVGVLGVTSVGDGRVRYVGVLQDPNEVALAVGCSMPLAVALFQRRRTQTWWMTAVATVILGVICIKFTGSRGGILIFLAVLAAYFIQRFGWKGVLAGSLAAGPTMLLLMGAKRADADESSVERLECWNAGMEMWRENPLFGVGFGQFTEHHYLTAHNSFVLAPAELGTPGAVIWMAPIYLSLKIVWRVLRDFRSDPDAAPARIWAMALLASMVGLIVGVFFLSFCYHYVLWVYLGLVGAFYSAVRTHAPNWRVRLNWLDLVVLVLASVGLSVVILLYTRWKIG